MERKERIWTKDFTIVTILNFFSFLTHMMVLSTFPFLVSFLGYSETVTGVITTMFSVVSVVSRIFIGYMLDTGKRKLILIIGLALMAVLPMGYLFVYAVLASIVLTVVIRMLHAVGFAVSNTAAATVATDLIPKSRFAGGMGMFGVSTALATAVAPAIGEFLMNRGFPVLYIVTTLIMVLGVILAFTVKVPYFKPERRKFAFRDLIDVNAVPASIVALIYVMTYGSLETYILIFASDVNTVTISGSWYFIIMAVMLMIARFSIGSVTDKRGERIFVYICFPVMALSLLLLAFVPGNASFILSALLSGFAFGCMQPTLQAMAVSLAPPERRGAANSTFLCAFDIGIGIGSGIAGVLITRIGYHYMYAVLSVTAIIALILYILIGQNHPSSLTWQIRHREEQG